MKYLIESEMILDGKLYAKGSIVENPSTVKVNMVPIEEVKEAVPAKPKKVEKVEEVKEEILVEDSADIVIEKEEDEE